MISGKAWHTECKSVDTYSDRKSHAYYCSPNSSKLTVSLDDLTEYAKEKKSDSGEVL